MIDVDYSLQDLEIIKKQSVHHPNVRIRLKLTALWLKWEGVPQKEIADRLGVSTETVRNYIKQYNNEGLSSILTVKTREYKSALDPHRLKIKAHFLMFPPATCKEAAHEIKELTGIEIHPSWAHTYLRRLGLKKRKVGKLPTKADPEAQAEFKKKELEPRLREAEQGRRHVFFVDASHFVYSVFIGYLWCAAQLFVNSTPSRSRFNVLGAIHSETHHLTTIETQSNINSFSVRCLLRSVAKQYQAGIPITFVVDSASYFRTNNVQELAAELNIELLYLPTASPNLNLIERVWGFMKKRCLGTKYFKSFRDFKSEISSIIREINGGKHQREIKSLLSKKFQDFSKIPNESFVLMNQQKSNFAE